MWYYRDTGTIFLFYHSEMIKRNKDVPIVVNYRPVGNIIDSDKRQLADMLIRDLLAVKRDTMVVSRNKTYQQVNV